MTDSFLRRAGRAVRAPHAEQPADLVKALHGTARVRAAMEADRVILPPMPVLQDLCRRAAEVVGTAQGVVTILTATEAVVKACWGDPNVTVSERFPVAYSYCAYVIRDDEPIVVPDTRDSIVVKSCLAVPDVGAYAGAPIRSRGVPIGALAGYAVDPQEFRDGHEQQLVRLADEASALIAAATARSIS